MSIRFGAERWARTKEVYRKWWAGELDRPLVAVTVWGGEADRPEPTLAAQGFHSFYPDSVTPEQIVDRWDYDLSRCRFLGDAFPSVWPNFGPGAMAAFVGCRLENGTNTVWFHPEQEREIAEVKIRFDAQARWYRRIAGMEKAAAERWQGTVQVGMTDLGGALDVAAAFRPSEKLLLDLYDQPAEVKRVRDEVHAAWWQYFDAFNRVMRPPNPGYTAWTPIFSETPYYMLQCDFAYMIGPDMFDEFVKPELAASCRKLDHGFYHLDGTGQLPHLDSLLGIRDLKGVQWVPGEGTPDVANWPEVYRQIQAAGKRIQLFHGQYAGGFKILDVLKQQLGDLRGVIVIGGADAAHEGEMREMLARYGVDAE